MQWFKCFAEWAGDPKVQTMTEAQQRRLIMLYCLCCTADPTQLTDGEIANALRISLREWRRTRELFVRKHFMEEDGSVPNFEARQTPADPTAAQRMRRYRANHPRNAARNGTVTPVTRAHAGLEETSGERDEQEGRARPPERSRNGPDPDPGPGPDPDPAEPESIELARFASGLGGADWGAWAMRMQLADFPAAWIKDAMLTARKRGQFRIPYADAILASYREQGGPDREVRHAAPADVPRTGGPKPLAELGPPPFIPPGPAGDAIRKMYDEPPGDK